MTDELETLVRDGLRRRAEEVDTTAPLVARVRQAARRRRGTRAVLALAAGVAVVAGLAVAVDGPGAVAPEPTPAPTAATGSVEPPTPLAPAGWRTERWHDLAVYVPADWGYGPAPLRTSGAPHICGDLPDTPYVGRPIHLSDLCIGGDYLQESAAPYVWLGADVEPGFVTLPDGIVQETVEVAGTTLTVAADDPLRRRILASVRTGGTCPSALPSIPEARLPLADTGDGLQVCGYRRESARGRFLLVGSQLLEPVAARRFTDAYAAAAALSSVPDCRPETVSELVLLRAAQRQWLLSFPCSGVGELGTDPRLRRVLPAAVEPWAVGFVPHTLYGPTGGKGAMIDSFIGTLP